SNPPPDAVRMVSTFTGPAIYTAKDKFVKVSFSDIDKEKETYKKTNDGWLGMLQHYFVSAWLPKGDIEREFYTRKVDEKLYNAGVLVNAGAVAPGKSVTVDMPLYVGPQEVDKL